MKWLVEHPLAVTPTSCLLKIQYPNNRSEACRDSQLESSIIELQFQEQSWKGLIYWERAGQSLILARDVGLCKKIVNFCDRNGQNHRQHPIVESHCVSQSRVQHINDNRLYSRKRFQELSRLSCESDCIIT